MRRRDGRERDSERKKKIYLFIWAELNLSIYKIKITEINGDNLFR